MRHALAAVFLFLLCVAPACKSAGCCGTDCDPQVVVERVKKENPDVTRLTIHCLQAGGSSITCASTVADKKGKPSDPEDLKAMQTGQTVVLDEAGALDVTVPILAKDGKFGGACGVTMLTTGMTREQAVAKAKTIAQAVDQGLGGCCPNCCSK